MPTVPRSLRTVERDNDTDWGWLGLLGLLGLAGLMPKKHTHDRDRVVDTADRTTKDNRNN